MTTITPAELADFLETNPRKARGAFVKDSGARCALGWLDHLTANDDGRLSARPEWVRRPAPPVLRVRDRIVKLNDGTPGWASVIAYLRTLTRTGRPKRVAK